MGFSSGDVVDRYEVLGEIGEGGMAVVYRARHNILHSTHAIKILHEQYARQAEVRKRFLREGQIQAKFRHPYITPISDVIALPGVAGLVMPMLEGQDLDDCIRLHGPVPTAQAIAWAQQILSALQHVHSHGVIHRDLKPANIFIEREPTGAQKVRVMDFGIAKVFDSSTTRTAMTMGTPAYMSPEQIRSPRDVDARSDLFAVGAILYEMLAGHPAFQGDTEFDIHSRIVQGQFTPLHESRATLGGPLGAIIERALSVEPDARFQTAAEFSAELAAAVVTSTPAAHEPDTQPIGTAVSSSQDEAAKVTEAEAEAPLSEAGAREPLQILLEDVVTGEWSQVGSSWELSKGGQVQAQVTPTSDGLEVQIRSSHMQHRPFIPHAEEHGGWDGSSCCSITPMGWYTDIWIVQDERGGHRLAWLISQEWGEATWGSAPTEDAPPEPLVSGSGLLTAFGNIIAVMMLGGFLIRLCSG